MVERGILCVLIGAAVLLAPRFLEASGTRDMIAGASVVGWFAVVLGVALMAVDLFKRNAVRK
jgi:hypothetical protein